MSDDAKKYLNVPHSAGARPFKKSAAATGGNAGASDSRKKGATSGNAGARLAKGKDRADVHDSRGAGHVVNHGQRKK